MAETIEPNEPLYEDYDGDMIEDDYDDIDDALEECGQIVGGSCMNAGTEYCDFECPYRDIVLMPLKG